MTSNSGGTSESDRGAELALCHQVAQGDRRAAQTLARLLMPTVRTASRRLTRGPEDAKDAVQVALLEVLRSAGSFRGDGPLRGWASRIAMRAVARFSARQYGVQPETLDAAPEQGHWASTIVFEALPRPLSAYLDALPEAQRTALVLRHSLECTIPEIAEITDSPVPTVKSRLVKGLQRLREAIRRDVRFGAPTSEEVGG